MPYKLSIGIITKNEAGNLERCLDSLLPILHWKDDETLENYVELIVVDTGSEDRSVQVAQKYTDKVYVKEFIPWHFSNARNFSISKCSGERFMYIDTDEALSPDCIYLFKDLILNPKNEQYKTIFLKIRNIYSKDNKEYNEFLQPRIFTLTKDFNFKSPVHNIPSCKTPYFFASNIHFMHYGYKFAGNKALAEKKYNRSFPILLAEYKKDPTETHILTHLVKTCRIRRHYDQVIKYGWEWINAMKEIKANGKYHEGWYSYLEVLVDMIDAYLQKGDMAGARKIEEETLNFTDRLADIYVLLGFHFMDRDQAEACKYFEKVAKIVKTKGSAYEELLTTNLKMVLPRIYNFLARYYFQIGNVEKAGQYLNEGIYKNQHWAPLRWDVWNYIGEGKNDLVAAA